MCDKRNEIPCLCIIKWTLFVPKVATMAPKVSAPEQKNPGKKLTHEH